jgi:hypothetical protein
MMRRHTGVAVLAGSMERQRSLRMALDAAGIAHWMVLLQDTRRGLMLPPIDGPLLLDTVGFERSLLAAVLAELHDRRSPLPTLALVGPDDLAAQRLSLLCSAVYAVASAMIPLVDLRLWFRYVGMVGSQRLVSVQPACLGFTPALLPVHDADLLRILAELPQAATMGQVAAACGLSERTFKRKLMTVRMALGIAANGLTRSRPRELAALVWTALAAPSAGDAGTHQGSTDRRPGNLDSPLGVCVRSSV